MSTMPGMRPQMSSMSGIRPQMRNMPGVRPQMSTIQGIRPQMAHRPGMSPQMSTMSGTRPQNSAMQGMRQQIRQEPKGRPPEPKIYVEHEPGPEITIPARIEVAYEAVPQQQVQEKHYESCQDTGPFYSQGTLMYQYIAYLIAIIYI